MRLGTHSTGLARRVAAALAAATTTLTFLAASASALLDDMTILVPMKGIIDIEAEKARLLKQRSKLESEIGKAQGKLSNEKFVNNAPASVVTQERDRLADFNRQMAQLEEQLAGLGAAERD